MQNQATNNVIFIKKWETNLSFSSKFTILIVMTPKPYIRKLSNREPKSIGTTKAITSLVPII